MPGLCAFPGTASVAWEPLTRHSGEETGQAGQETTRMPRRWSLVCLAAYGQVHSWRQLL